MEQTEHDSNLNHDGLIEDTDPHFSIDVITRTISNQKNRKTTLMQYDHNSERYSFDIERYVEGHDLMNCNRIIIHYINTDSNRKTHPGAYLIDDIKVCDDDSNKLYFSWLISENATHYDGLLSFLISFECVQNDKTLYRWNTNICNTITISKGFKNDGSIAEEYSDILLAWEKNITDNLNELKNNFESLSNEFENNFITLTDEFNNNFIILNNDLNNNFNTLTDDLKNNVIPNTVDDRYVSKVFATTEEIASLFEMEKNYIIDIFTSSEMDNLILEENIGNKYRYTGETDEKYVEGGIYEVRVSNDEIILEYIGFVLNYEVTSNKTQNINENSTTEEYPSAYAVYDFIKNNTVNNSRLIFHDCIVEAFESTYEYEEYPYVGKINVNPCKPTVASVIFSLSDSLSGNFAPICNTDGDYVIIYCKEIPNTEVVIPTIILEEYSYGTDIPEQSSTYTLGIRLNRTKYTCNMYYVNNTTNTNDLISPITDDLDQGLMLYEFDVDLSSNPVYEYMYEIVKMEDGTIMETNSFTVDDSNIGYGEEISYPNTDTSLEIKCVFDSNENMEDCNIKLLYDDSTGSELYAGAGDYNDTENYISSIFNTTSENTYYYIVERLGYYTNEGSITLSETQLPSNVVCENGHYILTIQMVKENGGITVL